MTILGHCATQIPTQVDTAPSGDNWDRDRGSREERGAKRGRAKQEQFAHIHSLSHGSHEVAAITRKFNGEWVHNWVTSILT
jgi:hypothetical protein